jgi:hypothetical protein
MLHWRTPDWFWHQAIFIFFHLSIPLLLEAVTLEWRFCVADSVPVPLSGKDLKAHLIINSSSLCPVSWFCPPSLTQNVRSPLLSPPEAADILLLTHSLLVLPPCPSSRLPSPPCAYWDPGLPWETLTMVPHVFLQLLPHLVCHAPWSTPALNWLLGASGGKGTS